MVGRFNPLTIYHLDAIRKMPDHQTLVATTRSYGDKNNPLNAGDKWIYLDRALTTHIRPTLVSIRCDNVIDAVLQCKTINLSTEVVLYCGSDRAEDYLRLNTYTEPEGIRIVDVVSIDRLDVHHSATHLRELAVLGKKKEFKALCGYVGRDKDKAYHAIRTHYGCI